jgi:hypothetical protein
MRICGKGGERLFLSESEEENSTGKEGPDFIGTDKEERVSDVPMNESEPVTD